MLFSVIPRILVGWDVLSLCSQRNATAQADVVKCCLLPYPGYLLGGCLISLQSMYSTAPANLVGCHLVSYPGYLIGIVSYPSVVSVFYCLVVIDRMSFSLISKILVEGWRVSSLRSRRIQQPQLKVCSLQLV